MKKPAKEPVKRAYLVGQYRANFPGLPQIDISIDKNRITFIGCNTNNIAYTANYQGKLSIPGPASSTKKMCKVDNDAKYVKVLQSVTSFTRGDGIVKFKCVNSVVAYLHRKVEFNQLILNGEYTMEILGTNLPKIDASINDRRLSFHSCNTISMDLLFKAKNVFAVGPAMRTLAYCHNSRESEYISALECATKWQIARVGKKIVKIFLSTNGKRTVRFIRKWLWNSLIFFNFTQNHCKIDL